MPAVSEMNCSQWYTHMISQYVPAGKEVAQVFVQMALSLLMIKKPTVPRPKAETKTCHEMKRYTLAQRTHQFAGWFP